MYYLSLISGLESRICQTDEEFEARPKLNPLYEYATYHRGHHAREVSSVNQILSQTAIHFLQSEAKSRGFLSSVVGRYTLLIRFKLQPEYSEEDDGTALDGIL